MRRRIFPLENTEKKKVTLHILLKLKKYFSFSFYHESKMFAKCEKKIENLPT